MGAYLESAAALGRRTADMHVGLAADTANAAFAPVLVRPDDAENASLDAIAKGERVLQALSDSLNAPVTRLPTDVVPLAERLLASREAVVTRLRSVTAVESGGSKIRIHGDYRLAQILMVEADIYIQNFEGHPTWPAAAQREKLSPLRDVASMVRSLSYAAHAALLTLPAPGAVEIDTLRQWGYLWQTWASAAFLQTYLAESSETVHREIRPKDRDTLLAFFMLDRALRELDGELNNRPDWVGIPLRGILELLNLA